jgi:hypothetical protein
MDMWTTQPAPVTYEQWRELDFWQDWEDQWREGYRHPHEVQLIEVFKDSKADLIVIFREEIKKLGAQAETITKKIRAKSQEEVQWEDKVWADIAMTRLEENRDEIFKRIDQLKFRIRSLQGKKIKDEITQDDIDAAKLIPITEYYTARVRRSGGTLHGLCPFHEERTPSFTIWVAKNRFKCFGCGVFGDSIDYVCRTEKLEFLDAVKLMLNK